MTAAAGGVSPTDSTAAGSAALDTANLWRRVEVGAIAARAYA
jgi:hypothetical protein